MNRILKRFWVILICMILSLNVISCGLAEDIDFESTFFDIEDVQSAFIDETDTDIETDTEETYLEETDIETDTLTGIDIETQPKTEEAALDAEGVYTSKEDVAYYIYLYHQLPQNFITKKEAEKLGWSGGGLDDYMDGACIGGSRFGNYEGILPESEGRTYTECDIDTLHKSKRGAKRIVFSNDWLIFYTDDHYETFTLLYDENGRVEGGNRYGN